MDKADKDMDRASDDAADVYHSGETSSASSQKSDAGDTLAEAPTAADLLPSRSESLEKQVNAGLDDDSASSLQPNNSQEDGDVNSDEGRLDAKLIEATTSGISISSGVANHRWETEAAAAAASSSVPLTAGSTQEQPEQERYPSGSGLPCDPHDSHASSGNTSASLTAGHVEEREEHAHGSDLPRELDASLVSSGEVPSEDAHVLSKEAPVLSEEAPIPSEKKAAVTSEKNTTLLSQEKATVASEKKAPASSEKKAPMPVVEEPPVLVGTEAPVSRAVPAAAVAEAPVPHAEPSRGVVAAEEPSSGWGWGASTWGLQALSSKIKEAAAGTVKEWSQSLNEFQQALGHAEDSPINVPRAEPSSKSGPAGPDATGDVQRVGPSSKAGSAGTNVHAGDPVREQAVDAGLKVAVGEPRAAVAAEAEDPRLVAVAAVCSVEHREAVPGWPAAGSEGMLHQPDDGMAVVDEHVEQLASEAARALASLGGMLSGMAKGGWTFGQAFASKVEAATKDISAGSVSKIGDRLEKGLENVGRHALELLEGAAEQDGVARPPPAAGGSSPLLDGEPATFEDFFSLYGGVTLCEEAAALSAECARSCDASRPGLDSDRRAQLERLAERLRALFDADLEDLVEEPEGIVADPGSRFSASSPPDEEGLCWEQLQARYDPVDYLVQNSLDKAAAMAMTAVPAVPAATNVDKPDEGEGGGPPDQAAPADQLRQLAVRSCKRLAEVAAAQIQLLLDSGKSLAAPSRVVSEPLGSELDWPASPSAQALLVRRQATLMMRDLRAVFEAYMRAATAIEAAAGAATAATEATGATAAATAVAATGASATAVEAVSKQPPPTQDEAACRSCKAGFRDGDVEEDGDNIVVTAQVPLPGGACAAAADDVAVPAAAEWPSGSNVPEARQATVLPVVCQPPAPLFDCLSVAEEVALGRLRKACQAQLNCILVRSLTTPGGG